MKVAKNEGNLSQNNKGNTKKRRYPKNEGNINWFYPTVLGFIFRVQFLRPSAVQKNRNPKKTNFKSMIDSPALNC